MEFALILKQVVDAGEVRLPTPGPGATRPPRAGRGGVEANTVKPLSKNPGAVHAASKFNSYWDIPGVSASIAPAAFIVIL